MPGEWPGVAAREYITDWTPIGSQLHTDTICLWCEIWFERIADELGAFAFNLG